MLATGNRRAEVLIFGEIGWEVTASTVDEQLRAIDADELMVRINSPGGDAYEGVAVMNALRHHPAHVTGVVEGLAASAASVIAVGGCDRLVMRPGAELMVHNALIFTQGNAAELTKTAGDLARVSATIAEVYAEKAGTSPDVWAEAMDAETWFSAQEAVDAGLADAVEDAREGKKALAGTFNLANFRHAGRADAPAPQISAATRASGKEMNMTFVNEVARKLGVTSAASEATVLAALDQVLAEQVAEVTVTTEVTYPDGVEVVPTGTATVAPTGTAPTGLVFSMDTVPDGWTAEVNETTGEVTVTAPDGAAVDDTADLVVAISGGTGDPSTVTITATVVSASPDSEGSTESTPPVAPSSDEPVVNAVTIDREVYQQLLARAARGDAADTEAARRRAEEMVNAAIRDGKVLAAKRDALVKATHKDPSAMKAYFDGLAPGTIPVSEVGYGTSGSSEADPTDTERDQMLARARRSLGIR